MSSEIEPIKDANKTDGGDEAGRSEDVVGVKPVATKVHDSHLEELLASAKQEAIKAGESSIQADRLCTMVKKLGASFKSGRMQAEADLELELGKAPLIVRAFLQAGESAQDPKIAKACRQLLAQFEVEAPENGGFAEKSDSAAHLDTDGEGGPVDATTSSGSSGEDDDSNKESMFVSVDLSDELAPTAKIAESIFADNMLLGVVSFFPTASEDRQPNYSQLSDHEKTAAMVKEYIRFGNVKALSDLRLEAGRHNWPGISSVAPTAYHRCCMVKAVADYEKALITEDIQKQRQALQELAKLRCIKLGSEDEYGKVHEAIDAYLKAKIEDSPELLTRDMVNRSQRKALDTLTLDFQLCATALVAFALANSHQERQAAYDAFKKSAQENPDPKILGYAARLGDYVNTLRLKELLAAPELDAKAIGAAVERLNGSSPALTKELLADVLTRLKADPATREEFSKIEDLTLEVLRKLIEGGRFEAVVPHLKVALESQAFKDLFEECANLKIVKHSAADLLRVGVRPPDALKIDAEEAKRNPNELIKGLDAEVESAQRNILEANRKFQELERKFLTRDLSEAERSEFLKRLKTLVDSNTMIAGDSAGLANTYELEAINHVISIKDSKDPAQAAEHLLKLQKMADAGDPFAQQLLDSLCPGAKGAESLLARLNSSSSDAVLALTELKKNMRFADDELDKLRIRNLTYEFRSDRVPSVQELEEFQTRLNVEKTNSNSGADRWLEWAKPAALISKLVNGFHSLPGETAHQFSDRRRKGQVQTIQEVGQLVKGGNVFAGKMLLGVLLDDVNPQARAQWSREFNGNDGPKILRPNLSKAVELFHREITDAGLKPVLESLEGAKGSLDRGDAMALALVLGQQKFESDREKIDKVLKKGIEGPNGKEVLAGVFDAIRVKAPGGEYLARTLLHGANRAEFPEYFPAFARWAESGDKVGMLVVAGVLAGRREKADLVDAARETALRCANNKTMQPALLEALLQTYQADLKSPYLSWDWKDAPKGDYRLVEVMGDVLAKYNKAAVPEKLLSDCRNVFRSELKFFDDNRRSEISAAQEKRYEHLVRGFMAMSQLMEVEDLALFRVTPQLAKAMREKDWEIPKEFQLPFKEKLFADIRGGKGENAAVALDCLGSAGRLLERHDIDRIASSLPKPMNEVTEAAYVRCLLQVIGAASANAELKDAALKLLEKSHWYNNKLDVEVRGCLSEYIKGRVSDVRLINRVIALVGDCGIEPPAALVISRLGVPLTNELIRDVEEGLRNFGGDRAAYLKVVERAVLFNATVELFELNKPPKVEPKGATATLTSSGASLDERPKPVVERSPFADVYIPRLVKCMAEGPLVGSPEFGFLETNFVEKFIDDIETCQYDGLITKSAEGGAPGVSRQQIKDYMSGWHSTHGTGTALLGTGQKDYDQALADLCKITEKGHETSYWWLAAAGHGYVIRRFGPGGTVEKFGEEQTVALARWRKSPEVLAKAMSERDALINGLQKIDVVRNGGKYVDQLANGNVARSDSLALQVMAKLDSRELKAGFPYLFESLHGTHLYGENRKPGEIWARLRTMHATNLETTPKFSPGNVGASEGLHFLQVYSRAAAGSGDVHHQFRFQVHEVAMTEAFRAVDHDDRMINAVASLGKISGLISSTDMLFRHGMAGHRSENYTEVARTMATDIERAQQELKKQEGDIRKFIVELKAARDSAADGDAKNGLTARIDQLQDILDGYLPDAKSKRHDEIKEMCRIMHSSDFDPGTLGKWLRDNVSTMILITVALAGIALMPFSGGMSGFLTAVAVAALVATIGFAVNEAWKEGLYQFGGAAYGSDFLRTTLYLRTFGALDVRQKGIRYDVETGNFKAAPEVQEVLRHAVIEMGKEFVVNLVAAGFGKFVTSALKAASGTSKLAATELINDARKVAGTLEKLALANPAARSWGGKFVHAWATSLPWAAFGATAETILQDEAKEYKKEYEQNKEIVEFIAHVGAICLTVLTHRVGGHMMRPRVLPNGNLEIPYEKNAFIAEMKAEYTRTNTKMPEFKLDGDTLKASVGGRIIELRFVDPAEVAAKLNKGGVRPESIQPGENLPRLTSGEIATSDKVLDLKTEVLGKRGPGITDEMVAAAEKLARETGGTIVIFGSRQTGKSEVTGKPFRPDSDIDLGVVGGVAEFNVVLDHPVWKNFKKGDLAGVDHFPMRLFDTVPEALGQNYLVVRPKALPVEPNKPSSTLPMLDPKLHMIASETPRAMHPEGAVRNGGSVLSYDKATPVVIQEAGTGADARTAYTRAYAFAEPGGGAVIIRFHEIPQDLLFQSKQKFQQTENHKLIDRSDDVAYFFDKRAGTVLRVQDGLSGSTVQTIETSKISKLAAQDMGQIRPAIRPEPSLQVTIDGQSMVLSSMGNRELIVGSGARADIKLPLEANGGASLKTDGNGFFVRSTGAKVEVLHADGTISTLKVNEVSALRTNDRVLVAGQEVKLTPSTSNRYSILPVRNLSTENRATFSSVDMVKVPVVADVPAGFSYCENLAGSQRVPARIFDPARDPILKDFEAQAKARFENAKGDDAAKMRALTEYVHERMTPRVVDLGYGGQPVIRQGTGMNKVAEKVDTAATGPMLIGDILARQSAVCLDQAMMLKYLSQRMGLKTEVTTGTMHGQPHAWVTLVQPGGKRIIFDPRNNNQLTHQERSGIPQNRDYKPFSSENPRSSTGARSNAGEALSPKMKSWFEHDQKSLKMDAEELATMQAAIESGQLEFKVMDRNYLRSANITLREAAPRPSSQSELPANLANYDPLKATGPVLVVYDPKTYQYHIMNGNNRVMRFGSKTGNPDNVGLPVWQFNSPEAYEKVFGVNPHPMVGRPMKLD